MFVDLLAKGHTIGQAAKAIGVTEETYRYHRKRDSAFAARADAARSGSRNERVDLDRSSVPDFPEFCERYLGMRLFWHQLQWFDILEGRAPRDLHPAQVYEPRDPDLLCVNTPPEHAKSTTITRAYVAWRIYRDPNVRIIIASKRAGLANQFLGAVKQILTHPAYHELNEAFGPPAGWDDESQRWAQDAIYVSDAVRDPQEKDPTVQALGIGGSIYGARADLIILDDCVDNSNANDHEKQMHWLETEVMSRLVEGGKLILIGTRLAQKDLYGEILKASRKVDEENVEADDEDEVGVTGWTYFAQPAILEGAEKPSDIVTLWPRTNIPSNANSVPDADGLYPKHDGIRLTRKRRVMSPERWARVYQQAQVADDQVFQPADVEACTEGRRPGIIPSGTNLGRREGMHGLYVVAGVDPAAAGFTAITVYGVDFATRTRHVIDVVNKARMQPDDMKQTIRDLTDLYNVKSWRVERNAFQDFLVRDIELTQWMASRGVEWSGHITGKNKWDEELGVAAMASLFKARLITLPSPRTEALKAMVEQLTTWSPDAPKRQKTDIVMSLWFAELKAQDLLLNARVEDERLYARNPFLPRGVTRDLANGTGSGFNHFYTNTGFEDRTAG